MSHLSSWWFAGSLAVALAFSGEAAAAPHGSLALQSRPVPARDAKVAAAGTGAIWGRVIAADTGAPLRRALVRLSGGELKEPEETATDSQGRYEFAKLPAGRYSVHASKRTYVALHYGQRWAFEAGTTLDVVDGGVLEKVDLALPRGGVISGILVDDYGEPLPLACVMASRSTFERGKRRLTPAGEYVETNDLGQYRLFGLAPGTYLVRTCRAPRVPFDGDFAPAYYPGTLNPGEASSVVVQLGQEHGGVDFVQPPVRLARLSGTVVDSSGRPYPGAAVQVISAGRDGTAVRTGVKADGRFSVEEIVPGDYFVGAVQLGSASSDTRTTQYPLTITAEGHAGLVLQMLDGCRVQGRVVTDEGKTPSSFSPAGIRVTAESVSSDLPLTREEGGWLGAPVKDDWTFDMTGMGGSFLFRIPRLPPEYMIKSVLLDGRDFADKPLDIKGTDPVNGLQVVITRQVTEVGGAPVDKAGRPVGSYSAVVFADDAALWRYPSRFVATARPDQQGRFRIRNLPPGRYLAVALEYVEPGQEQDPEYLESLRSKATPFNLSWGEAKTLDLKLR